MKKIFRNKNFYLILFADACFIKAAYFMAYVLRFEGSIPKGEWANLKATFIWIISLKMTIFIILGLYKGMLRYTSLVDFFNLIKATTTSSTLIMIIILLVYRFEGFSRSVFIIDFFLTFLFIGGFRITIRLYYHRQSKRMFFSLSNFKKTKPKRVLIAGAGDAGEKVIRGLYDDPRLPFEPIGFVDDDPRKIGREIHHVSVLGTISSIPAFVRKLSVDEIFITIPSASGEQMRKILKICKECNVSYKTLPSLPDLIKGKVSINDLREVRFEDLLGRPSVNLDVANIKDYITDKRILVTGAGGSIGSELCRQIVRYVPESIVLLDASEPNLYAIQMEFENQIGFKSYIPILGGIQSEKLVGKVFSVYRPQVVFHAAAYKHVPMLELNPWQAVHNNIRGTQFLLENSIEWGVKNFVLVSTDKSVKPKNVMGASKRVCELLLQSHLGNGTALMAVRFGNVVGSSGSVLPLFRDQIERGGPVTVTHPDVTRYFMTISEACQLILQAGGLGKGGEIFILKMGTPVRIADMARDLIRLSGKEPDKDIKIEYTGLRAGEKLYEELIAFGEGIIPTEHEKIMILKTDGKWNFNGNQRSFQKWLNKHLEELYSMADLHRAQDIREKLQCLVPEYQIQKNSCVLDAPCSEPSNLKIIRSTPQKQFFKRPIHSDKAALSAI